MLDNALVVNFLCFDLLPPLSPSRSLLIPSFFSISSVQLSLFRSHYSHTRYLLLYHKLSGLQIPDCLAVSPPVLFWRPAPTVFCVKKTGKTNEIGIQKKDVRMSKFAKMELTAVSHREQFLLSKHMEPLVHYAQRLRM